MSDTQLAKVYSFQEFVARKQARDEQNKAAPVTVESSKGSDVETTNPKPTKKSKAASKSDPSTL